MPTSGESFRPTRRGSGHAPFRNCSLLSLSIENFRLCASFGSFLSSLDFKFTDLIVDRGSFAFVPPHGVRLRCESRAL